MATLIENLVADMRLAAGNDPNLLTVIEHFRGTARIINPGEPSLGWCSELIGVAQVASSEAAKELVVGHEVDLLNHGIIHFRWLAIEDVPCRPFYRGVALFEQVHYLLGCVEVERLLEKQSFPSESDAHYTRELEKEKTFRRGLGLVAEMLCRQPKDVSPLNPLERDIYQRFSHFCA